MATVIKANDSSQRPGHPAFNFDDISRKADDYLAYVRQEAAKIVAEAQQQAAEVRRKAEQEGRAAAQRELDQKLEERIGARIARLTPTLAQVATELREAKASWLLHWQTQAVQLAAAIAARVVRRELSRAPEITIDLVREALEMAAGSPEIRVRLNPADFESLGGQAEAVAAQLGTTAEFVADSQITAGGCRIDTRFGSIDQQIEAQLARIEEELC